jgi:type I restriction enzyme S subunit
MTPHDLLAAFDILVEAPSGIARLRELILQLAVRGKLVPQDPNDEPACVLLERIAAEKARLVKAGKLPKPRPLPPVSEDEVPFEVPEGWVWCRVDDCFDVAV